MGAAGTNKLEVDTPPRSTQESGAVSDFLRVSRIELDGLIEKSREIQEDNLKIVNSSLQSLHLRLYEELDKVSSNFLQETRNRAQQETSAMVELLDVEASARMSARLDEALEKARGVCVDIEKSLTERVEQHSREALANLLAAGVREIEAKAGDIAEKLRAEMRTTLVTLKSEASKEGAEHLRKTSDDLSKDLQSRAEKAQAALMSRLAAAELAMMANTKKQMDSLSQSALANVGQQAEAMRRQTSDSVIRDVRKRLDQLTHALQHLDGITSGDAMTEKQ